MTKRILIPTVAMGIIVLATASLNGVKVQHYRSARVDAYVKYTFKHLLMPHSEPEHILKLDKRTYRNARGRPPFFMQCSNSNLILFVTDDNSTQATFHFYNLEMRSDFQVVGHSDFGYTIGYGDGERRDFCEFRNPDEVLIYTRRNGRRDTQILNLTNKTVSRYLKPEELP